jgi:hypothetical protein
MPGQGFSDFRTAAGDWQVLRKGDRRQRIAEGCRSLAGCALLGRLALAAFVAALLPALAALLRARHLAASFGLRRACTFLAAFAALGSASGRLRRRAARLLAWLACRTALLALRPLACWLLGRILLACFRHRFLHRLGAKTAQRIIMRE